MTGTAVTGPHASSPKLPRSIWTLGFVSMFTDISSEMIHGLLPVFLVTVLGASTGTIGLIEGVGEATASVTKLFSGWLSDKLGKRKALTVIGYGLGALSKPLFAIAMAPAWVMAARFSDRIGKGVRDAPRDALIGELTAPQLRGAAYGLRQALDTVGAFVGPLIAIALMAAFNNNFRLVFWLAVIPAIAAVTVLVLGIREPARVAAATPREPVAWNAFSRLGHRFWAVAAMGGALTLARFSEAFVVLRLVDGGLAPALAPMVLVVMNIAYAVTAYPMGVLSDRLERRLILAAGCAVLIAADLVLAQAAGVAGLMIGVALWGLHMGMTQGLLSALVADSTGDTLRGTAFGVFNLATGLCLLLASLVAGLVWESAGPGATFLTGAGFTAVALVGTLVLWIQARPGKT